MEPIKSFLYLDEYKMYSISSQIFEGLTEYSIDSQGTINEETEKQKGPFGSGRVLGNILRSEFKIEEKRYLHDYSYSIFEHRLNEQERIRVIDSTNITEAMGCVEQLAFVKIRAKAVFNDMNMLKGIIEGFNDLGEALAYVTNFDELQGVTQQLAELEGTPINKSKKAKLRKKLKELSSIEALAAAQGLRQDPNFLEKLALLLDFGFQDQLEVRMNANPYTFSANLKRDCLREDEHLLVRKYSRFPEKTFVLFGTIAQSATIVDKADPEDVNTINPKPDNIKEAVMGIVEALYGIEQSFTGKLADEVVIDPIALYREI